VIHQVARRVEPRVGERQRERPNVARLGRRDRADDCAVRIDDEQRHGAWVDEDRRVSPIRDDRARLATIRLVGGRGRVGDDDRVGERRVQDHDLALPEIVDHDASMPDLLVLSFQPGVSREAQQSALGLVDGRVVARHEPDTTFDSYLVWLRPTRACLATQAVARLTPVPSVWSVSALTLSLMSY
jgi:hypothetical protein